MSKRRDATLFDNLDEFTVWWDEWQDMPEFVQEDLGPWKQLVVNFSGPADLEAFSNAIGRKCYVTTRSIWYPQVDEERYIDKRYKRES